MCVCVCARAVATGGERAQGQPSQCTSDMGLNREGWEGRRRGRAGQGGCTRAAPGGCLVGERSLFGQQLRQGHPAVARPCRRRSRSEAQSRGSRGAPAGPYAVSADTGARARGRQCRAGACVPTDVARRAAIKAGSQKLDHEHGLRTNRTCGPRTAGTPESMGKKKESKAERILRQASGRSGRGRAALAHAHAHGRLDLRSARALAPLRGQARAPCSARRVPGVCGLTRCRRPVSSVRAGSRGGGPGGRRWR